MLLGYTDLYELAAKSELGNRGIVSSYYYSPCSERVGTKIVVGFSGITVSSSPVCIFYLLNSYDVALADFGEMFEQVPDLEQNFGEGRIAGRFGLEHEWFSKLLFLNCHMYRYYKKIYYSKMLRLFFSNTCYHSL